MGSLVRRRWLALLVALLPLALPAAAQDSPATDSCLDLNADPHSIGFTDRPERLVRFIDTEGFVSRSWGTGGVFAIDPPNASLIGENGTLAIVELTAALWSDGRLGLDFVLLEGDLPAPGDRAVLTIDTVACCDTLQCWDPNTCPQA
jgi:hypothetical protein